MTGLQRTDSRRRRALAPALRVAAVLAVAVGVSVGLSAAQAPSAQPDLELGKRMYRQGLLPSGQPMRATVQGDVSLTGPQLPCATCHGRSGFGARESAVFVPPITGPSLYRASEAQQASLFSKLYQARKPLRVQTRVHDPRLRPAYTDATLAIALREGKDPTGRTLDPLMPRYLLGEADLRHLSAYLQALSATPSPGVTASTIHFATVITDGVEPARRQAMLDVLEGYVQWKNADTIRRVQRSGLSAWYKEVFPETYRVWALHVWQLTGPAETWHDQLNTYYRQQPVFALLSGMGTGAWQPVHDFCEATEVACLFPHTDLPVVAPAGMYTLYLSKGLTVEARSLAYYLHTTTASDKTARLVQVYRDTEYPRNTGQCGVGPVLCGTEFSHEFKHPSEDRPTWDFGPKACGFSTQFVNTASRAFDNLPSELDFAKAASIVILKRWPAETVTPSRGGGKRQKAAVGSSAWWEPPSLFSASSAGWEPKRSASFSAVFALRPMLVVRPAPCEA
jgi:cytochrome c553